MRSPAQHPSRLRGQAGGLELELGIASASQPRSAPSAPASGRRPAAIPPAGTVPASGRRQTPPIPALGEDDDALELGVGFDLGPSAHGPGAAFGAGDSAWDEEHDALDVGLDLGAPEAHAPPGDRPAKPRAATPGGSPAAAGRGESLPARSSGRGATPAILGTPTTDDYEVKTLAQYGPVPAPIWAAPQYAWRVFKRRQALRKQLTRQQGLHEEACKAIREKLAAEVDAIADGNDIEELTEIMAPIEEAEQLFGQRRAQIDATAGQYAAQFADIDKELAAEQETRKQRARDREMAQIQVEDAIQKHAKVAGELKRLDAMIADAHEQAQLAAGGAEFAPPEHARKIAALEAQKAKVGALLQARQQALLEAKAALRQRAAELRAEDERIRAIHARTTQTEAQAGEAKELALEGMKQAHQGRLRAYETALERICRELPQLVDDATLGRIDELKRQLAAADVDLERHRLAVDAYDKPTLHKGIGVAAAAALVLLVLLVALVRVG